MAPCPLPPSPCTWHLPSQGRHVDRTFTICYLPTCLLFIGVFIRFPKLLSRRLRILTGFGGFFCLMLAVPMVRGGRGCQIIT